MWGEPGADGARGPAGIDGRSVVEAQLINDELVSTFSDQTTTNLGNIRGAKRMVPLVVKVLKAIKVIKAIGAQGLQGEAGEQGVQGG